MHKCLLSPRLLELILGMLQGIAHANVHLNAGKLGNILEVRAV